jgi:hypothetical protein
MHAHVNWTAEDRLQFCADVSHIVTCLMSLKRGTSRPVLKNGEMIGGIDLLKDLESTATRVLMAADGKFPQEDCRILSGLANRNYKFVNGCAWGVYWRDVYMTYNEDICWFVGRLRGDRPA